MTWVACSAGTGARRLCPNSPSRPIDSASKIPHIFMNAMARLPNMSGPESSVVYGFGEFELDAAAYELRLAGVRIRLARQPMELLLLMVRRSGDLVSRDEIAKHLWQQQVFVDVDAGIQTAVLKVRQALGDAGRRPTLLETVSGKGYRFAARVEIVARDNGPSSAGSWLTDLNTPRRHNLPAQLTTFVGRAKELEELQRLLATVRVLTLTGAGGVGKTRLALQLAQIALADYPHGVWVVDLGSLSGAGFVAETIASTLGLREDGRRSTAEVLTAYLRTRDTLIVLDTCEHVVVACAELVETVIQAVDRLRIITTTREPLS